ncbi:MAG: bifunctional hydroxymethylpyrimidine kinase/phosphomethylpyrimidine kinase [Clostridiales bacterium]|jgi:hydroxymethylpyrimidine/phosphomethylpyrimidine kinase|nr:bifunctional hydroxymethylpyrimidine kinase/phosphomethylpyrimidine kinase [Clostridiales bacterium]
MRTLLTIAGSDSGGGAGIQADMRTATMLGLFSMSVITAVTAQNTLGVNDVFCMPPDVVGSQLDAVFSDIMPDCVKIGMLGNGEIAAIVADKLEYYKPKNVALDPIILSTSGHELLDATGEELMKARLIPLCDVITPNIHEAERLSGVRIKARADMQKAAEMLGGNVVITGGHLKNECTDLLLHNNKPHWFTGEKIENPNTHGTGCTFSSALACNLALGHDMVRSAQNAREYVRRAIMKQLKLGRGNGPLGIP